MQPEPSSDEVTRLAAALKERAREPFHGVANAGWMQLTRRALADAEIALTDDQFDRAWRAAWQSAFMGGNFTQDARRILVAARSDPDRSVPTTEDRSSE